MNNEHELMRRNLWCNVAASAVFANADPAATINRWTNAALEAFDKAFPEPIAAGTRKPNSEDWLQETLDYLLKDIRKPLPKTSTYRILEADEVLREGDEIITSTGWIAMPPRFIGNTVSNPSLRNFRRPVTP